MDNTRGERSIAIDLPLSEEMTHVVTDAGREAGRLQHEYIGTEHLLLALTQPTYGALPALAVDAQRVRTLIDETVRRGRDAVPSDLHRPFTSRTKQAFTFATESARELGHTHVTPGHIVVGLLREGKNIGAQVLTEEGLTIERAYEYARGTPTSG